MKEIISITLVVDENKDIIEECLESVLNQDNSAYELIIFDNASIDGSFDILTKYMHKFIERGVYCRVTRNRRKYDNQFNNAAVYGPTIGNYVIQITPEMRLPHNFVSRLLDVIEQKRPGAIIFTSEVNDSWEQGVLLDFTLKSGQIVENRLTRNRVGKHRESFFNYRTTYRAFLFSIIDDVEVITMDYQDVSKTEENVEMLKILEKYRVLLACKEIAKVYDKEIQTLIEKKYSEIKRQCIKYSETMEQLGNEREMFRYGELAKLF